PAGLSTLTTSAPRSASIIPAHGPVMNVPCSTTRMPERTDCMAVLLVAGHEAVRLRSVVVDCSGARVREHETDRPHLLLEQMCDQTGGAREDRHAFERSQWKPRVEQHRGYRDGDVHRKLLAGCCGQDAFDRLCRLGVKPARAGFDSDFEQADDARIASLVQRMTVTGDCATCRAILGNHRLSCGVERSAT